jgi:precorrin-6B methylase 2
MGMTIQDFVDSVATKAGVDTSTAETAVGTILSAIQQEGNSTKVVELFSQIPGAADLAQKHAVVIGGGGMLGSLSGLASSVVGKDAGVLVAAIGQLEETNLTMEQIKKIGTALLSYLKESANPALAKEVVDSIPSLRERFGHA